MGEILLWYICKKHRSCGYSGSVPCGKKVGLSNFDQVRQFPPYQIQHETCSANVSFTHSTSICHEIEPTEKYPRNESVRKESRWLRHVAEGQNVQVFLASATRRVHREEYRPSYQATYKAHKDHHFEEANVEVSIKRLVIKNELIVYSTEIGNPAKKAGFRSCPGLFTVFPSVQSSL